jgi:hypothetical protein
MRIGATNGTMQAAAAPAARRGAVSGFSVGEETPARSSTAAGGLRTVAGIDALLALQGVEDPLERRRHAVKRGRTALDALEELKLGILAGTLPPVVLNKLRAVVTQLQGGSGDVNLDAVLGEIELRVEVEIAKIGRP